MATRGLDRQIVEGHDLQLNAPSCRNGPQTGTSILARSSAEKIGAFEEWTPMATTILSATLAGLAQDVQMAVGDGVEAAGIEGGAGHEAKA
jgi:hypothetical protein